MQVHECFFLTPTGVVVCPVIQGTRRGVSKILCPFHQEQTASMVLYWRRRLYKCFGCGKEGQFYAGTRTD